jgi:hypothetical protein
MNTQDQNTTESPAAVTLKRADIAEEACRWRRSGQEGTGRAGRRARLGLLIIALVPAGPVNDAVVVSTIVATACLGLTVAFSMGYAHALTKFELR